MSMSSSDRGHQLSLEKYIGLHQVQREARKRYKDMKQLVNPRMLSHSKWTGHLADSLGGLRDEAAKVYSG